LYNIYSKNLRLARNPNTIHNTVSSLLLSARTHSNMAPPSSNAEDIELIQTLYRISNKSPKLIKPHDYPAPADPDITVSSWKMNEWKYYDVPSPFPTLARGLFTVKKGKGKEGALVDGQESRIVARGYDKFFNIGEVPWCTVRFLSLLFRMKILTLILL
jgi:tRNA ligase